MGTALDLDASIVNLRRLADKLERGDVIVPQPVRVASTLAAPTFAAPAVETPAVVAPPKPVQPQMPQMPSLPPLPPLPPIAPVQAEGVDDLIADDSVTDLEAGSTDDFHDPDPTAFDDVDLPEPVDTAAYIAPYLAVIEAAMASGESEEDIRRQALVRLEQVRLEISDLAGRRMSPWTRRRLDEAEAEERAILDRLGLDSYLDVMLAYAAGSAQAAPVPSSSRPPSLTPASGLPLLNVSATETADDSLTDNGGSDDVTPSASSTWSAEVAMPSPVPSVPVEDAPATADPEAAEDVDDVGCVDDDGDEDGEGFDPGVTPPHLMVGTDAPATVADWLRSSSFAGALDADAVA